MRTKSHFAAIFALALAGCASSGPTIDAQRLTEVRKGETTYAEISKRFGRPSFYSRNLNGTQTAVYVHAGGSDAAVIPLIAAIAGAHTNADSVSFHFDESGVLRDYKLTQRVAPQPAVATATAVEGGRSPTQRSDPAQPLAPDVIRVRPVRTQTGSENAFLPGNTWTIHTIEPAGARENR